MRLEPSLARRGSRAAIAAVLCALGFSALALSAAPATAAVPCSTLPTPAPAPTTVQDEALPDQVFVLRTRRGRSEVVTHTGVVTQNELAGVALQDGSKSSSFPAAEVQRIAFGDAPPSYRDGLTFFSRGDFENAAARFRVAATDPEARPVVQAAARLAAGESLLRWATDEPVHFTAAVDQLDSFLSDHPTNRAVPRAQELLARAAWCAGDADRAASAYRALFEQLDGDSAGDGYAVRDCLEAGLQAGKALLAAGDTLGSRELLGELESSLDAVIATRAAGANGDSDGSEITELETLREEALILREGHAELIGGNLQSAKNFFENRESQLGEDEPAAVRFSILFGLGEVRRRSSALREAELLFAKVAALDYSDRDRVAAALVAQAESAREIGDSDSGSRSKLLLQIVVDEYGDTPAARSARSLLPADAPQGD